MQVRMQARSRRSASSLRYIRLVAQQGVSTAFKGARDAGLRLYFDSGGGAAKQWICRGGLGRLQGSAKQWIARVEWARRDDARGMALLLDALATGG